MTVLRSLAPREKGPPLVVSLNSTHENENNKNNKYKSQAAGGAVAPIAAVPPSGQRANEDQNEDDNENCAEHGNLLDPHRQLTRAARYKSATTAFCSMPAVREKRKPLLAAMSVAKDRL